MRLVLLLYCLLLAGVVKADPGWGIVRDAWGNVYYTDLSRVWRIAPDGRRTVAVEGVHTHALALDAQGHVYGEHLRYEGGDRWSHRVWRLSPDGQVHDVIPTRSGFLTGYGFARDSSGTMYWAEGDAIYARQSEEGAVRLVATAPEEVYFLTALPDGALLFYQAGHLAHLAPGATAVRLQSPDLREPHRNLIFRTDEVHRLYAPWPGPDGSVYVPVYPAGLVKRIRPGGQVETAFRTPRGWKPIGGLTEPDGTVWLMEWGPRNATRVRRIRPDGRVAVWG